MEDEVEDDPPSFSFHALTASTMLMPADILSFRKRLYSLGLRFSFFAGFLPNWAIVLSCRFRASETFLSSLLVDACAFSRFARSEEHTSELQSQSNLVCRLLLEKNNT